jgi:hypothetical protein
MNNMGDFSIQVYGSLIVVDLTGNWTEQNDLSYLSSLTEEITRVKREPWGLLVDMRGWTVQQAATEPTFKITLDRRNQKVECWIVDDLQQGDFLLTHFQHTPIKPLKFLNPEGAIKHLKSVGFELPKSKFFFNRK